MSAPSSIRSSSSLLTAANIIKMTIGVSFISVSKSISLVGIYCSLIGFLYTVVVNIWSVWLIIKARDAFKEDESIVDLCDLSVRLYGDKARKYIASFVVLFNCLAAMLYQIYFGTEVDQLMCQTLMLSECGHPHLWSAVVAIIMLPVVYLKSFKNIGYFSIFTLILTFVALSLVTYVCFTILIEPKEIVK